MLSEEKKMCFPEFDLNDKCKPVLSGDSTLQITISVTVFTTVQQTEIHLAGYNDYK